MIIRKENYKIELVEEKILIARENIESVIETAKKGNLMNKEMYIKLKGMISILDMTLDVIKKN